MNVIQSAFYSPDLGEHFKYLLYDDSTHRNSEPSLLGGGPASFSSWKHEISPFSNFALRYTTIAGELRDPFRLIIRVLNTLLKFF